MGEALSQQSPISLSKLTTMRVGGAPKTITRCETTQELYAAALSAENSDEKFQLSLIHI